jgi:hypothetical protein
MPNLKQRLSILAFSAMTSAALAQLPLMNAECPGNLSVHYDGAGNAYINGNKAQLKTIGENMWDIHDESTTISISLNPDKTVFVSYAGPHRANGICRAALNAAAVAPVAVDTSLPGPTDPASAATQRAANKQFDSTSSIPCALHKGQPMGQCTAGVARAGNGDATVIVNWPDGRSRAIFFTRGKPVSADSSQADGYGEFKATRESDLNMIRVGDERYEIVDAFITGG